jgi:hypothetical protein
MSHRPPQEIEILEDQDDPHRVNKQSFVDEQVTIEQLKL